MGNRKSGKRGITILCRCPVCRGDGKVAREVPFLANPKAPMTRAGQMGYKTCPKCLGSGSVGVK